MASTDIFAERYGLLNAAQRQAVDTLEGPVMVVAGPGTGKTEVLSLRIANILRSGGPHGDPAAPERILALTFTESGAISMRRRLTDLVGADAYRVEISTFHGFANRIIRDHPDRFPEIIGGSSITEIEQVDILRATIDALPLKDLRPFGDRYHYLRSILASINEVKRQGVSPDAFAVLAEQEKADLYANPDLVNESGRYEGKIKTKYVSAVKSVERNVELASVYAAYQKALRAAHQYDYSDMIMEVLRALETDDELLRVLGAAYDFFLVDEHQDTNDAQNRIIELIAGDGPEGGPGPNLFVVGDEKQAIFQFQGASIENFRYFQERYRNVKLIALTDNYRSTQAILDAAQGVSPREHALIARTDGGRRSSERGGTDTVAGLAALPSPDAEYYFIARTIGESIAAGTPAEEIAVLYRDNKDAAPLARMLEKQKVPFVIESDQDVLGDEEIAKLVRVLRAIQRFGNDAALAEALHTDFLGIAPIDVYRLSSFAFRERRKLYDVLREPLLLDAAGIERASKEACLRFAKGLSDWRRAAKNRGAAETFEMIVSQSGALVSILNHPSATEKLAKLHTLFDLLKSFIERQKRYTLDDFFRYLDLMEEHGLALKGADATRPAGRVRLMTAHRAKGMEFDVVFVMNAADRKWGSRFRRESIVLPAGVYRGEPKDAADDDADERNVFYVALTRARRRLLVTYAKTDRDGKEQLPTKFIAALAEGILAPVDTASVEKDFAERRHEIEFAPVPPRVPELEDKEFLNGLFRAQGISVTALNNYLECPWAYFYRNLVRIPEAPNKHLAFGNAVHAALKSYFDAFTEGEDRGEAYLVKRFEEALAHEPVNESEYEEALAKGRRALGAFYAAYRASWPRRALAELRVDGVMLDDGTAVNGKLDRVEFLGGADASGGEGKERVRVIDYKTGRTKTRNEIEGNTKSSDGNYKRQLVFYKMLLDREGEREMADGVIQFIEPDERGKMHREEFAIAPGEVAALEGQVMQVAREILDLSFWDKGCSEPDCRYCALRRSMQ